jgi:hypothetical protein
MQDFLLDSLSIEVSLATISNTLKREKLSQKKVHFCWTVLIVVTTGVGKHLYKSYSLRFHPDKSSQNSLTNQTATFTTDNQLSFSEDDATNPARQHGNAAPASPPSGKTQHDLNVAWNSWKDLIEDPELVSCEFTKDNALDFSKIFTKHDQIVNCTGDGSKLLQKHESSSPTEIVVI